MRSRLERVAEDTISDLVTGGWGLDVCELRYLPEGAGAYHWMLRAGDARRWFVTCDDLDTKPWLGVRREEVFDGLLSAYRTAIDLSREGLAFVVAPVPATAGEPTLRVDDRHSVSIFRYVEGRPGRWGRPISPRGREELVTMLARLHASTAETHLVSRRRIALPHRRRLEAALDDVDRPWDGGPLSEAARRELGRHVDAVGRALRHLDELTFRLERRDTRLVVTHGEPHPGNLIETPDGHVLIDWDTVGLARPERDLWMIADSDVVAAYRDLTGIMLEREALIAYGLLWALTDVAAFTVQLRGEHELDADGEHALEGLRSILVGNEPAPYGSSIAASLPWAAG